MARTIYRLTAKGAEALKAPGRHADGGNLYLSISAGGAKSWVFVYRWQGRTREKGLGSFRSIDLKNARAKATVLRRLLAEGQDPLSMPNQVATAAEQVNARTFGDFSEAFIGANELSWRNAKHRAQWRNTLKVYAANLRSMNLADIQTEHVLECLLPIWSSKPETASRVRGRIERILAAAKAEGLRAGDNPAAWHDHLKHRLPARPRLTRGHHAAMRLDSLPAFLAALRSRGGISARALEFSILTAARTGEVIGATWAEIDFAKAAWTVAGSRMKAGREHRVPLSERAVEILRQVEPKERHEAEFVFPGLRPGRGLSTMALETVMRRMKVTKATVHGFRSTFRDWAAETTPFANELVEMALAHTIGNKVEAAYRRGDLFDKRRELMNAWAAYCGAFPATLVDHRGAPS